MLKTPPEGACADSDGIVPAVLYVDNANEHNAPGWETEASRLVSAALNAARFTAAMLWIGNERYTSNPPSASLLCLSTTATPSCSAGACSSNRKAAPYAETIGRERYSDLQGCSVHRQCDSPRSALDTPVVHSLHSLPLVVAHLVGDESLHVLRTLRRAGPVPTRTLS